MMDEAVARGTRPLATTVGVVAVGSAISLATYFAVGGPFGTLNDIGNAATGVLSAGLAWRLREQIPGRAGAVATGAAVLVRRSRWSVPRWSCPVRPGGSSPGSSRRLGSRASGHGSWSSIVEPASRGHGLKGCGRSGSPPVR
jgi:hypothetical protein